jgi:hypothetical protein
VRTPAQVEAEQRFDSEAAALANDTAQRSAEAAMENAGATS